MTTFPLTTTLEHVHANCMPVPCTLDNALRKLENSPTHDTLISYAQILDASGLEAALHCCRAEPQHEQLWRSYTAWCFDRAGVKGNAAQVANTRRVRDAACIIASKIASDTKQLVSAFVSTRVQDVVWDMVWDEAWDAESQAQADAFRQLVTTGTLP